MAHALYNTPIGVKSTVIFILVRAVEADARQEPLLQGTLLGEVRVEVPDLSLTEFLELISLMTREELLKPSTYKVVPTCRGWATRAEIKNEIGV
jgi:hypothetical protein